MKSNEREGSRLERSSAPIARTTWTGESPRLPSRAISYRRVRASYAGLSSNTLISTGMAPFSLARALSYW